MLESSCQRAQAIFFWIRLFLALLRDAILRTLQAAEIAGIRAILVPAISESDRRGILDTVFILATKSDNLVFGG
jgi:hypothetical protein